MTTGEEITTINSDGKTSDINDIYTEAQSTAAAYNESTNDDTSIGISKITTDSSGNDKNPTTYSSDKTTDFDKITDSSTTNDPDLPLSSSQNHIHGSTTHIATSESEETENVYVTERDLTTKDSNGFKTTGDSNNGETTTDSSENKQNSSTDRFELPISTSQDPVEITLPTTNIVDIDGNVICPPDFVGIIGDNERCDKFYHCSLGQVTTLYCLAGHEFDGKIAVSTFCVLLFLNIH